MRHWEGLAHVAEAKALATAHGGTARRVESAEPRQELAAGAAAE
jgi:hypothetical protein